MSGGRWGATRWGKARWAGAAPTAPGGVAAGSAAAEGAIEVSHELAGVAVGSAAAVGGISSQRDLSGVAVGASSAAAALEVSHEPAGVAAGSSSAAASVAVVLPALRPPRAWEAPGTVNLVRNPSAEVSLDDWAEIGGATIDRDGTRAFDGVASVRVDLPGIGPDEGVAVGTVRGLAYVGVDRVAWGSLSLSGAVSGLVAWVRGHYADGSSSDGDRSEPFALEHDGRPGNWRRVVPPAYFADADKTLVWAEVRVARAIPDGPAGFWADAAQIEEDRGQGATPFAIGSYRSDLGRWTGAEHLSPSIRQPAAVRLRTPAEAEGGRARGDGALRVEGTLWRCDWQGVRKDEVPGVLSCEATMEPGRGVTWTLSAELTAEGWARLTPFVDWVAPVMTVTLPDGTVREGQLGLYHVLGGEAVGGEWGVRSVALDARDPLWLLGATGAGEVARAVYRVGAGVDYGAALRHLLAGSLLTEDGEGRPRYRVADTDRRTRRVLEWDGDTPRLDVANSLLRRSGYYPLWTDRGGVMVSERRGADRLRRRQPVRVWAANLPPGAAIDRRLLGPGVGLPAEVVGDVSPSPRGGERLDGIVLVTNDPHGRRGHARGRLRRPRNPRIVFGRGERRRVREVRYPVLDSDADAMEVAMSLLEEAGAGESALSVSVVPDPSLEYAREVVGLGVYDAAGGPVAVGRYHVIEVSWGFGAGDGGLQRMELGKIGDWEVEPDDGEAQVA